MTAPSILKASAPRIVTVGAGVTETVFALGRGRDIVAADAGSLYPRAVIALPKFGYSKGLGAGEVLDVRPDIVLVADEAGPKAALDAIAGSGVQYLRLAEAQRPEDIADGVRLIAGAIGERARGAAMAEALESDLALVGDGLRQVATRRRALVLLGAPDAYRLIAAGRGSPAGIALAFAGAENAADRIDGWSWIEPSLVGDLAPDAIVSLSSDAPAPIERVIEAPGVRDTVAGREKRVATADSIAFSGFGPRAAQAIHAVASQIYPETRFAPLPARRGQDGERV